jgi:hypothetical protein
MLISETQLASGHCNVRITGSHKCNGTFWLGFSVLSYVPSRSLASYQFWEEKYSR